MDTIKLKYPILVDGKEVKELPFDTSVYEMSDAVRANRLVAELNKGNGALQESDYNYHLIVSRIIVEKSSRNKIAYEDLARLKGTDILTLQRYGRDFLFDSVIQEQENLNEQSEVTADCSK